jgi:glycosyltransferase involved in cell wall biosynthesis
LVSKLNILFLSSWYPNKEDMFAGNFVQRHAKAVSTLCDVTVLYFHADSEIEKPIIEDTITGNLREVVVYYPKSKFPIKFFQSAFNYLSIKQAFKNLSNNNVIDINKYDLLHLNVTYPVGLFAVWLKNKFKLPLILTEHSTRFLNPSNNKMGLVERIVSKYVLSNVDVVCPVSYNLEKAIQKNFFVKQSKVVKNVVDSSLFKIKQIHNKQKTSFIHVSTLRQAHKNIRGIVEAVFLLLKSRKDFELIVIGDGNPSDLERAIDDFKISDEQIKFLGPQPIEEVAKYLSQSDALILFSNFENLPCVISEAHVCGIPVISTNVGGISEMIDDTNGLLIPPRNTTALVESMNFMIDNLNRYDANSIRKAALSIYGTDAIAQQFLDVYKSILEK